VVQQQPASLLDCPPSGSALEPAALDLIQMCWDGNLVAVQSLLGGGTDPNAVERKEVEGRDGNWPPHKDTPRCTSHASVAILRL